MNEPWEISLGRCVAAERKRQRLGLRELARQWQMSPATLCRIEHCLGCDLSTLAKIQARMKVSYDVLLGNQS